MVGKTRTFLEKTIVAMIVAIISAVISNVILMTLYQTMDSAQILLIFFYSILAGLVMYLIVLAVNAVGAWLDRKFSIRRIRRRDLPSVKAFLDAINTFLQNHDQDCWLYILDNCMIIQGKLNLLNFGRGHYEIQHFMDHRIYSNVDLITLIPEIYRLKVEPITGILLACIPHLVNYIRYIETELR